LKELSKIKNFDFKNGSSSSKFQKMKYRKTALKDKKTSLLKKSSENSEFIKKY